MSAQIKFKLLELRNFMSFGSVMTSIDLSTLGSALILGENIDTLQANGAGKTTIINALCYALYNKPFDNISLQRLINSTNSAKSTQMEVRLTFEKGENEYVIHRARGEAFSISITINGEDKTLDSVSGNDKLIEEIIGISYELFTKIIVFSGSSIPFLQLPVSQQRQQIEELFNITMLSEKAVKLKELIKTTENGIEIQAAIIKERETQLALYQRQLQDAEARVSRWEADRDRQLEKFRTDMDSFKEVNMEDEKELHKIIAETESQLPPLKSDLAITNRDVVTLTADIKKLNGEIQHLTEAKCPYCLQAYAESANKLSEKIRDKEIKEKALKTAQERVANLQQDINDITAEVTLAKSGTKFPTLEAAIRAETAAKTALQKIHDLQVSENPHVESLQQLQQHAVQQISTAEIDKLKRDLEHQQFLLKLLTDKNSFIRRRIINRTIPFLNNRLATYTKELGLPHVVRFDDDMSCTVSEYGRELDYGNLSNGEKKRVNLSLLLAFRDVLHHLHAKVNCLFIDEIDASLDATGVDSVFRLLKQKTRDEKFSTWIISHRPEAIGRFDRTLIVRKENGFSRIIEDVAA